MKAASAPAGRLPIIAGVAALVILAAWLASWTGRESGAAIDAAWVLLTSGPWVVLWVASAAGFGWTLRSWLARTAKNGLTIQLALGIAALFMLDEIAGMLGWMQAGGTVGAWLLLSGVLLLLMQVAMGTRTQRDRSGSAGFPWMLWCAAPALAVLLVASCSAPGWLWATEFGGYDALSYHLQLPKEWLAIGRIEPLNHNVYSYLPGYVEAAYYHLAVLIGEGIDAAYACQLLHAAITIVTALTVSRVAFRLPGTWAGAMAFVVFLGTPWIIVVGSLGYNEMPTLLMLAAGMLVIDDERIESARKGLLVGLFIGAACGAKLTSIGFVAAPLMILLFASIPLRLWWRVLLAAALGGAVMLAPYFLRNWIACGNPVFPFATDLFGFGHWTAEQASIWRGAHFADLRLTQRFSELWNQFLRFGIGPAPALGEPWSPQWSILPWLGLAGAAVAVASRATRIAAVRLLIVVIIQVLFWLFFTHLKSRFLLPLAIPMAAVGALGIALVCRNLAASARSALIGRIIMVVALIAWSIVPMFIYRNERNGAPAAMIARARQLSGDDLTPEQRREAGENLAPAIAVNHLLPERSKALLIGHATPFYFRQERIAYQTTWDRGPLSTAMAQFPNDPRQWATSLRQQGFTHLLVDEGMLQRWEQSGWSDPNLTIDRLRDFANSHAVLMYRYPTGITLYSLRNGGG